MAEKVECILKSGIVEDINGKYIRVRIQNFSACAGCHSKESCVSFEKGERVVDVENDLSRSVNVGDRVDVQMVESSGWLAVFLGYVLPFILLIATLIMANYFLGEILAALLALGVLVPYYLVLYAFRNKMKKYFRFTLS